MSEPQQPPAQPHGTPPQGQHHPPQAQQYSQQQYPAPQHPAQQYPAQQHPAQQHPALQPSHATAAAVGSGSLGRIALIVALVSLAIGLLSQLTFPLVVRSLYDPTIIGVFGAVGNGLVLIVAIVALVLGLMAVRRPAQQVLAGIAIGIAASEIAAIVISWASNLFFALSF